MQTLAPVLIEQPLAEVFITSQKFVSGLCEHSRSPEFLISRAILKPHTHVSLWEIKNDTADAAQAVV